MTRPKCCRKIGCMPDVNYYKPRGIPSSLLEEVVLTLDEFEALKLADSDGLYQEQAAIKMDVSRQTFGRIIDSAHKKIADVLIHGKALKIEGGDVEIRNIKNSKGKKCNRLSENSFDKEDQIECPNCKKVKNIKNLSQGE